MEYIAVDSRMLDLIGYNADDLILEVRYAKSGIWYHYFDVSERTFLSLVEAGSISEYMRNYIIGVYDYRKVGKKRTLPKE
jgi:hypothetical protein